MLKGFSRDRYFSWFRMEQGLDAALTWPFVLAVVPSWLRNSALQKLSMVGWHAQQLLLLLRVTAEWLLLPFWSLCWD